MTFLYYNMGGAQRVVGESLQDDPKTQRVSMVSPTPSVAIYKQMTGKLFSQNAFPLESSPLPHLKLSIQCLTHDLWPKNLCISPLLFLQSSLASHWKSPLSRQVTGYLMPSIV